MVIPVQPAATWIMETITICKKDATSMKTLIKSWMLIAAAAMAFTACTKDSVEEDNTLKPVQLTIQAGNPEVSGIDEQGTRTEMQGATPMWSANDQIGVTTTASAEASANHQSFTNDNESSTQTTTFSGSITIPAEGATLYAYYPYSNNGLGTGNKVFGALVDLPINQNPTATSFDGTADLLVSKPVQVTSTTTSIENMQFKRVSGVLKVVLLDNTTGDAITGQHVNTLSVATDESQTLHLAGRVVLDFVNGAMTAPYYNHSRSVVAHYTSATQYAIDGTNQLPLIDYSHMDDEEDPYVSIADNGSGVFQNGAYLPINGSGTKWMVTYSFDQVSFFNGEVWGKLFVTANTADGSQGVTYFVDSVIQSWTSGGWRDVGYGHWSGSTATGYKVGADFKPGQGVIPAGWRDKDHVPSGGSSRSPIFGLIRDGIDYYFLIDGEIAFKHSVDWVAAATPSTPVIGGFNAAMEVHDISFSADEGAIDEIIATYQA